MENYGDGCQVCDEAAGIEGQDNKNFQQTEPDDAGWSSDSLSGSSVKGNIESDTSESERYGHECACGHEKSIKEKVMSQDNTNSNADPHSEVSGAAGNESPGSGKPFGDGPAGGMTGQFGWPGGYDPAAFFAWHQQMAMANSPHFMAANPYVQPGGGTSFTHNPSGEDHTHHLKHDEHKYGQAVKMAEKFLNGGIDASDLAQGVTMLENTSSQFWKGAIVGGVVCLLFSSETVKKGLAGMFSNSGEDNK